MISGISASMGSLTRAQSLTASDDQLREAVRDFESMLLGTLLKQMRASTRALSPEKTSFARQTYEEWQDELIAKNMAASGGMGIGEALYRQLQQEQLAKGQVNTQ